VGNLEETSILVAPRYPIADDTWTSMYPMNAATNESRCDSSGDWFSKLQISI
jgi:hypothetical protein